MATFRPPPRRPKGKIYLRAALEKALYRREHEKANEKLQKLILRNNSLIGSYHRHVMFNARLYNFELTEPPNPANRVQPQLYEEFEDHFREFYDVLEVEKPIVMGYVTAVLNASENPIFYYEVLPPQLYGQLDAKFMWFTTPRALPPDDVLAAFLKKHESPHNLLKQRLLINLITET